MAELGERIRTLREAAGLTQEQVATQCGRGDKSTVAKWETGVSSPPAKLMPKLAKVLRVTVGALYGEAA